MFQTLKKMLENIVGKGDNAGKQHIFDKQHFSFFSNIFKHSILYGLKNMLLFGITVNKTKFDPFTAVNYLF